jgi:hypothetical protein
MSTSEPGRKARRPTSTVRPPLMRSMMRPLMIELVVVRRLDLVPTLHALGLLARQQDVAFEVLGLLEQHVDVIADADGELALVVGELLLGDQPLGLVADVDDHRVRGDADHPAADDLALGQVLHRLVVHVDEPLVLLVRHLAPGAGLHVDDPLLVGRLARRRLGSLVGGGIGRLLVFG